MESQNHMEEAGETGGRAIVKIRMEEKTSARSGACYGIQSAKLVTMHSHAVFAHPSVRKAWVTLESHVLKNHMDEVLAAS